MSQQTKYQKVKTSQVKYDWEEIINLLITCVIIGVVHLPVDQVPGK